MSSQSSTISSPFSAETVKATRLPAPVRITDQIWPEGTMPVVSVFCITYNHVNFIRDAIEGFLMQETTFPVEIFIHDDASTDGTAEIVKEYAEKYPKLFWTVLQTENQWSKGSASLLFANFMKKQRGEFIAFCEGDDYWIAKEKLQLQVSCLNSNHGCTICSHRYKIQSGNEDDKNVLPPEIIFSNQKLITFSFEDYLKTYLIKTLCVVFRKSCIQNYEFKKVGGDIVIWAEILSYGYGVIVNNCMGVYRKHSGGVYSSVSEEEKSRQDFLEACALLGNWPDKPCMLDFYRRNASRYKKEIILSLFESVDMFSEKIKKMGQISLENRLKHQKNIILIRKDILFIDLIRNISNFYRYLIISLSKNLFV